MIATVYAELDALLDVRMAVAKTLDPDALMKWGAAWRNRVHEHDPDIRYGLSYTHEQFVEAWENRDAERLAESIPTKLMWKLDFIVADWQRHQKVGHVHPRFKLVVNTYPYQFEGEALEALIPAIKRFLGPEDLVEIIYRNPATILPSEIRGKYTMMVMDDFPRWHQVNSAFLEDNPIPNVLFVIKRLSLNRPEPSDDLSQMFDALEITLAPMLYCRSFSMSWFSYYFPTPDSARQPSQQPAPSST